MHITRKASSIKLPIARKGSKYIALASSNPKNSVPLVIAIRDILKLAKTTREVKKMINAGLLKINNRKVADYHESINLFGILEAGKSYKLTILPTGKFAFQETKEKEKLCKIIGKTIQKNNKAQLNLHDGSNVLNSNAKIGDSLYLDFSGKVKRHVTIEKDAEVFIFKGKYIGLNGKVESIHGKKVKIKLKDKHAELPETEVIAL